MPIFLSFINTLIRCVISIKFKNKSKILNPISIFGMFCFALPLWISVFIYLYFNNNIFISNEYALYILIWISCVIFTNLASIYLFKSQSLSEQGVYRLCFSTVVSMIIDIYYFHTSFNINIIIGIILLFIAGILLSSNKTQKTQINGNYIKGLGIILLISIIGVIQSSAYKLGVNLQPNPLIHGMISQIILYFIVLIFGYSYLSKDIKEGKISYKDITIISILVFLLSIFETIVIKELSITVITLLGVLNILIYKIYDILSKEIYITYSTSISFLFVVTSLVIINFK